MTDGNRLVNQILSEIKQKMNAAFHERVYHDETIPRPGNIVHRVAGALTENIPEPIREMRLLVNKSGAWRYSEAELFYRQGVLMQDYEDDFNYYGECIQNFPTYRTMSVPQLRGYFSWRTRLRHGKAEQPQLSFALLYLYELLNQIGVESPEQGFFTLKNFWAAYRVSDSRLDRYMRIWLSDYIVYYNLDAALLEDLADPAFDRALQVLLNYQEREQNELFEAICALSSYHLPGSAFYRQYPEDVKNVVCAVFESLSGYYEKNRKKGLCEKLFGVIAECEYEMFYSAVFFDRKRYDDYEYVFNDIHRYHCHGGKWSCRKFYGNRAKSKELGSILRALDSRMREKYGFKAALKAEPLTKLATDIIEKAIDRQLAENQKNAAPKIEIDVSKLSGIRRAADITRERLLAEDAELSAEDPTGREIRKSAGTETIRSAETGMTKNGPETAIPTRTDTPVESGRENTNVTAIYPAEPGTANASPEAVSLSETSTVKTAPESARPSKPDVEKISENALPAAGLNDVQRRFLHCLLHGEDYRGLLRENRILPSVMVETINEALYEQFADTVIEFDGDVPRPIEDYAEELEQLCR
ncbi:MAG: TerB N-terminal domain-containing protein [Lachnospiraceae bacterium]|nr:TerB N-terminal domain-containing protein [Lachnospiraceae bacterium]